MPVKIVNKGITKALENIKNAHAKLRVGFPEGNASVDKAVQNEYGNPAKNIPPRPFMQQTVDNYEKYWADMLGDLLVKHDFDASKALNAMGAIIRGEIVDTILNGDFVPNAPYTVAKKGFNKPLVDTGQMQRDVTWGVED